MKMHKSFVFLLFCFIAIASHAQVETLVVGSRTDGTELKATCYTFPQRVETLSLSNKGEYLCINFRETSKSGKSLKNKGEIGFYDLNKKQLLWKQPINYAKARAICLSEGVLMIETVSGGFTTSAHISLLNKENGEKRWETDLYPIHVDDSLGLLLGYSSATSSKLHAIGLRFGNELWQTKLPHQYGWNEVVDLAGSQKLIVADELHRLDVLTGNLESYPGTTGAHDTKAAILQGLLAVAGAAAGAAASGGAFYYTYVPVSPNTITSLTSNLLIHDSHYYWADRKQISCIDTTLTTVWRTEFPDIKAGRSQLFVQDNKLFMLNYGYGLREGRSMKKYGRPFIACYDLQAGNEIFFNRLSMKKDIVENALRTDNALYMLFDDGMAYQTLADSVVNIVPWNTERNGKLERIQSGTLYVLNEDNTAFLELSPDSKHCLVYNDRGGIYEINEDLTINRTYNPSRIYVPSLHLKDYLCIGNKDDYWFVHETGMPIAHLETEFKRGRVVGNKLLLLNSRNQLLFIDLDKAIQ